MEWRERHPANPYFSEVSIDASPNAQATLIVTVFEIRVLQYRLRA